MLIDEQVVQMRSTEKPCTRWIATLDNSTLGTRRDHTIVIITNKQPILVKTTYELFNNQNLEVSNSF